MDSITFDSIREKTENARDKVEREKIAQEAADYLR